MGLPWWVAGTPWALWRYFHGSPLSGLGNYAAQSGAAGAGKAAGSKLLPGALGTFIGLHRSADNQSR